MNTFLKLVVAGIVGAVLLFIFVAATGQTFGQRCAKEFPKKSAAWINCVNELAGIKNDKVD